MNLEGQRISARFVVVAYSLTYLLTYHTYLPYGIYGLQRSILRMPTILSIPSLVVDACLLTTIRNLLITALHYGSNWRQNVALRPSYIIYLWIDTQILRDSVEAHESYGGGAILFPPLEPAPE